MAGLFISYRRSDSAGWAGRLKDHLEIRFGQALVWQDVDDIRPGAEWLSEILRAIRDAAVVLVIIGPRWLELGAARLADRSDVLRQEIEVALDSTAVVIPVLVGGATPPPESALPDAVRAIAGRQAVVVRDEAWHHGVQLLIESVRERIEKVADAPSLAELQQTLLEHDDRFGKLIAREPQRALATVNDALAMLDRQLPLHPQDALLQLIRAYSYKNQAIALDALGKSSASQQALERAERSFQVMRDELEANTASAYNGLGSVQAMRGNLRDSLRWIDRALALRPDYAEALRDRAAVKRELARRPRPARSKPKSTRRRGQPRRRR